MPGQRASATGGSYHSPGRASDAAREVRPAASAAGSVSGFGAPGFDPGPRGFLTKFRYGQVILRGVLPQLVLQSVERIVHCGERTGACRVFATPGNKLKKPLI